MNIKENIKTTKDIIKKGLWPKGSLIESLSTYTIPERDSFEKGDIVEYESRIYRVNEAHSNSRYTQLSQSLKEGHGVIERKTKEIRHCLPSEEWVEQNNLLQHLSLGGIIFLGDKKVPAIYEANKFGDIFSSHRINLSNLITECITSINAADLVQKASRVSSLEDIKKVETLYKEAETQKKKNIEEIIKNTKEIYPTSRVKLSKEFKFSDGGEGGTYSAVIHFPEIFITNSKGKKHTITDMFVRLDFNSMGVLMSEPLGTRSTITYAEECSYYRHSHLNGQGRSSWGSFCLGGTDLSSLINDMRISYDSYMYQALLLRLPEYLNWESLGGGPYQYINRINLPDQGGIRPSYLRREDFAPLIPVLGNLPLKTVKLPFYNGVEIDYENNFNQLQRALTKAFISKHGDQQVHPSYFTLKDFSKDEYVSSSSTLSVGAMNTRIKEHNSNYSRSPLMNDEEGNPVCITIAELPTGHKEEQDTSHLEWVVHQKTVENGFNYLNPKLKDYLTFQTLKRNNEKQEQTQEQGETA